MKNRDYFGGTDFDITGYQNAFSSLKKVLGCGELIVLFSTLMSFIPFAYKFWQKYFSKFSNLINSLAYSCSFY